VDAGILHDFHNAWLMELRNFLNGGQIPPDYYALTEQDTGQVIVDLSLSTSPRPRRRNLAIRHVDGHRLIALAEIVSPANKDRSADVRELADKIESALELGVNVLLADLFRPGFHDPCGIHGTVWQRFDSVPYDPPPEKPLTVASYVAGPERAAFLEHLAIGAPLPDMPLFLHPERYIMVPLETTYQAAYRGMPAFWRDVLEGRGR
jgi:hypothetical protein